ncbi:hypothetical protein Ahy_A02g005981 isoform C [Arachis hypogaea]|uniref:CW-type domain-containing protein n=1 Tax=Arachis hypogaea TaxID=3818 RepID=A0A445E8H7_ARAHY|nr:hypothetical protein Ahy_A02g005981 isoform C [Arachis hypogaea]
MNFVEIRDARKGLGLGFGGGGRSRMEESELEEGEACSFQNHEEDLDDASIDPDVDLSYIDAKLQDVLGHFQKDFEGGVCAENLGAKFGGYGSFLPSSQRSPGWGHPRTPSKAHSQNTSKSSPKLQPEGGQGDAVQFSNGNQSLRPGPGSAGYSRLPAVKAPSVNDAITQENGMTTAGAEVFTSNDALTQENGSLSIKPRSTSDRKTLKFRIKMGADNLPTRRNAAIYSGLGLDVSPSSSLDDSPSESEGISHERQDAPFESPSCILKIMTDLPMLLSPLTDDLIQLIERETCARESTPVPVYINKPESSGMLPQESNTLGGKGNKKSSGRKKIKSVDGYESSMDMKSDTKKNALSRKEQGINAVNTEERLSKTPKLPLLSSSYSLRDDSVKAVEVNKGTVREKTFSDHGQKGLVESTSTENGFVERIKGGSGDPAQRSLVEPTTSEVNGKTKGGLGRKFVGEKVSLNDSLACTEKDNPGRVRICDSVWGEPNTPKNSKGSHGTVTAGIQKQKLKSGTSLVPKVKKSFDGSSMSKNETEEARVQKGPGKARDTYRDFFGELDEEEDRMASPETSYGGKLKETEAVKRCTPEITRGIKERLGGAEKVDKSLISDEDPKRATNVQYTNVNGAAADIGKGDPVSLGPVVMEDNWVQCDRCHKWRLLPAGTNPDSLPEKWLCSMLDWLPDMNRCNVSEDDTTKALITLYQVPPHNGQSNVQNVPASVMVAGIIPTTQQNNDLFAMPGGKKKPMKKTLNSANKDGSSQFSSSMKKSLPSSVKSRSLNDVNKSPALSNPDVLVKKHKTKQRMLEQDPDGGDTKNVKAKIRKDPDQDSSRPYKKSKIDGNDEEWMPQNGPTRKGGYSSNSNVPTTSVGKDPLRPKDRSSSRDSKYNGNDKLLPSAEIAKDKGQGSMDEGSLNFGNYDSNGALKKRKLKEYQDAQLQESHVEFSDSRKEKKPRNSKSEGRESSSSKGSGRTDKKGSHTKNHKFRQNPGSAPSQRSVGGMESSKVDLGPLRASAAATTSSSSKVSGSHQTKASFQELKGSPVESVSSSPMRILNADKFTNRELTVKDGFHDAAAVGSATEQVKDRCHGEDSTGVYHANVTHPRKIGKGSLLKDNGGSYKSESIAVKVKSSIQLQDESPPSEAKQRKEGNAKLQENVESKLDKSENILVGKKDYTENDIRKIQNGLNKEHNFQEVRTNGICKQEALPATSQSQLTECDIERSSKRPLSERNDKGVIGKGKLSLPPSGDVAGDLPQVDDESKLQKKQIRKGEYQNGTQQVNSRHPTINGHKSRELDNPTPNRRDSNNALKEAKDLKHLADRLKNLESTLESTGIYLRAALKFLHGASLLESSNNDSNKNEMIQSIQIYSSTAKLCEFCAHEYEKLKDMAGAALAYKCMEVAYMRVVYSSSTNASRDRHELQTAMQMVPLGESPSSSASDVDNVNNSITADKVALCKITSSPQVAGTHVIAARNRPNMARLLNYVQDMNSAMEASRRSRSAFAAANSNLGEGKYAEGLSSIKKALDFSFQDIEGLLQLVRLAMEAIARNKERLMDIMFEEEKREFGFDVKAINWKDYITNVHIPALREGEWINMAARFVGEAFLNSALGTIYDMLISPLLIEEIIAALESIVNEKDGLGLKEIPVEDMSWRIPSTSLESLKEVLSGKKLLVVLDDMWSNNYDAWISFLKPFKSSNGGVKILVTTRLDSIADMVKTIPTFHLSLLGDDHCWSVTLLYIGFYTWDLSPEEYDPCRLLAQLKHLRVLSFQFLPLDDSISDLIHLRYLDLSCTPMVTLPESMSKLYNLQTLKFTGGYLEKLPSNMQDLVNLLHLDLSSTAIEVLPESLSKLHNLQTLKLRECENLKKLPSKMQDLINLHHLDIEGTKIEEMPKGMSKLKDLQILCYYIVGEREENGIGELGELVNLQGSFRIKKLENVVDSSEAWKARMVDKKYISDLYLKWSSGEDSDIVNSQIEKDVLCKLEPHNDLKYLKIKGYRCTVFPDWVGQSSYHNMTELELWKCRNCCVVPSLGQLPSLERLVIRELDKVKKIGGSFYKGCEELGCYLPRAPIIRELRIFCKQEARMWDLSLSMLEKLSINGEQQVEYVFDAMSHTQPTSLTLLSIANCSSAISFSGISLPPSLKELYIYDCKNVDRVHQASHEFHHGSINSELFGAAQIPGSSKMGRWIINMAARFVGEAFLNSALGTIYDMLISPLLEIPVEDMSWRIPSTSLESLKKVLAGKKLLVVLDDMWRNNYDAWISFLKPFKSSNGGVKILVTTRLDSTADMVKTLPTYHLNFLDKHDACPRHFSNGLVIDDSLFSEISEVRDCLKNTRTLLDISFKTCNGYTEEIDPCRLLAQLKHVRVLSFKSLPPDELDSIGDLIHLRYLDLSYSSIETLPESMCKFYNLQTLKLNDRDRLEKLPNNMQDLVNLRHLDLSGTSIVELPESLSKLYNLQTLNLSACEELKKLPSKMQDLVNLRHLDIEDTNLEEMPKGMSKLKDLQILSYYIVGEHEENGVGELGELVNLQGSFHIRKLENVVNSSEAWKARMFDKKHINDLRLQWRSVEYGDIVDSEIEKDVLDKLRPHKDLKKLFIWCYRGTMFPDWVGQCSYHNMTWLELRGCRNCWVVPSLGQLPSLERLVIRELDKVKKIGGSFYKGCEEIGCYLPRAPILRSLRIDGKQEARMRELPLSMLETLIVNGEQQVEYVFEAMTHTQPTSLSSLQISKCSSVVSFPGDALPPSLKQLSIYDCKNRGRTPTFGHPFPTSPTLKLTGNRFAMTQHLKTGTISEGKSELSAKRFLVNMVAELVGGAFLSSFLNVLFDRLSDDKTIELKTAYMHDACSRHLSYDSSMNALFSKILEECESLKNARTLLIFDKWHDSSEKFDPCGLLAQLKHVRVLSFKFFPLDTLPDSIGELIHLRYLDLSGAPIVTLPKSMTNLYNLQTLKLSNCTRLEKLPINMQGLDARSYKSTPSPY